MKKKRELEIMLSALSSQGVELTEDVIAGARIGLLQIRSEKYAEHCERKAKYLQHKAAISAAIAKRKKQ